jgi:hypothetical protein
MCIFLSCLFVNKKEEDILPFVHDTRFPESSTRGIVQDFIETANYGPSFKQHESNNQFHPTTNNIFLRWGWVSQEILFLVVGGLHGCWMKGKKSRSSC